MNLDRELPRFLDEAVSVGRKAAADGQIATYIPELARADPNHFGMAVATMDGKRYQSGDAEVPFTFQSVSKVFSLALVLREKGVAVLDRMSVEPSGDAFHSIVRLEEEKGRPRNPYINAGAILVSAQLPGTKPHEKIVGLQKFLGELSDGAAFPIDEAVYQSETETGYRNRALANYMRHFGHLDDPRSAVETYFRQCSITLDTVRLARIGLFLCNRGIDPASGRVVIDRNCNSTVVAQMAIAGLYDEVGRFAVSVGVPAKSGVSGAMLAVVPGRMTVAVYGPALGPKGNSVAGMAALAYLSDRLELSVF